MISPNFYSHLSNLFESSDHDCIAERAANYLLNLPSGEMSFDYHSIDSLVEKALNRYFIKMEKVLGSETSYLGRLYATKHGFTLKIRQDIPPFSFRFVEAHELAHTLAYNREITPPQRLFPNSRIEENLCDYTARHILLPEIFVGNFLDAIVAEDTGVRIDLIMRLSTTYAVKPWQIVRRICERKRNNIDAFVGLLWRKESEDIMRIVEAVNPRGIFIPIRDRSFKGEQVNQAPWDALRSSAEIHDVYESNIGSLSGRLRSTSFSTQFTAQFDPKHVIQLIYLEDLHQQMIRKWRKSRTIP